MFDRENVENYSKKELIEFWISLREQKKEIDDDIKLITVCLMEMHELSWKERYGEYNVFSKETTSYAVKKWYDYSKLILSEPDLFQPNKAKMYKKYPEAIERKITNTIEMSKDKDYKKK